jgi:hypothetical protein
MRALYSWVGCTACSLLLAACSSIVNPEGRVELAVRPAESGSFRETVVVSNTRSGTFEVTGQISTPNPCRAFNGRAEVGSGIVDLTITSRSSLRAGQACTNKVGRFSYRATVRGLQSGTYRVRVIHAHAGTGWSTRVVADTTASVR